MPHDRRSLFSKCCTKVLNKSEQRFEREQMISLPKLLINGLAFTCLDLLILNDRLSDGNSGTLDRKRTIWFCQAPWPNGLLSLNIFRHWNVVDWPGVRLNSLFLLRKVPIWEKLPASFWVAATIKIFQFSKMQRKGAPALPLLSLWASLMKERR